MGEFQAKDAYRPYGRWLEAMHVLGPHAPPTLLNRGWQDFWPVCYGGGFAATREAVLGVPLDMWSRLMASLSRGDNIEEGHFMERSWAGLLTQRLYTNTDTEKLRCMANGAVVSSPWEGSLQEAMRPFSGMMFCQCKDENRCRTED